MEILLEVWIWLGWGCYKAKLIELVFVKSQNLMHFIIIHI